MKHFITLGIWIVTFAVGGALFWTSNEVQLAESANKKLVGDIRNHEEQLTILSAEWHYLNSPAYLDHLTTLAFNENTTANKPLMLTDSADLPKMQFAMLPVRKPAVPEAFVALQKESTEKAEAVIVASAKKVQSKKSPAWFKAQPAPEPRSQTMLDLIAKS